MTQNFAVQFFLNDETGIPDGWPRVIRPLGEEDGPLADGETLMTGEEIEARRQSLQSAMDARNAAEEAASAEEAKSRESTVRDAREDLIESLEMWDSMNDSQRLSVVKSILQVLVPIVSSQG